MANIITGIRIVCALALVWFPTFSKSFYLLYILGGISDILDGYVARHFGKESNFGERFDTIADIVFTAIVIIKVLKSVNIPSWTIIWTACIALIKCATIITGFIIHRRFVSEHTVMNKICGALLFAIPFCMYKFEWHQVEILIFLTCILATIAAVQEGHYTRAGKFY